MATITELKATKNSFTAVGTLVEKALELIENDTIEITANKETGEKKKVSCETIKGKFTVDIGEGTVTFFAYFNSVGYDGNEAKSWASAKALLDANAKVGGTGEPAMLRVTGSIDGNDYLSKQGEVISSIRYRPQFISTSLPADSEVGMTVETTAFVRKAVPEMKGEEETGRYKVELLGVDYKGGVYPITAIAEEEAIPYIIDGDDGFEPFEAGQTRTEVTLEYHIKKATKVVSAKRTFGRKNAVEASSSGRQEVELTIVGADPMPVEEPEEEGVETLWMNPSAVKASLKEREARLQELKDNPNPAPAKKTEAKSAPKTATKASTKRAVADDDDLF